MTDELPANTWFSGELPIPAPVEKLEPIKEVWKPVAGKHPALLYLSSLRESGRRSMKAGLEAIARMASHDTLSWNEFPWHRIRYAEARVIVNWLQQTYPAPATANAYRSALRGVLRECWQQGLLEGDEWARIQSIKPARGERLPRGRHIEAEEIERLYVLLAGEGTVVAARDAAWFAVVYSSGGVRLEESLTLTLAQFSVEENAFRVVGKGNKERKVWLSESAAAALRAWLAIRGLRPGYVFVPVARDRTTLLHGRRLGQSTVREMCDRRSKQAGIEHMTPHDWRRTSIGDVIDMTGDLSLAQQLAGHASAVTTGRYDRRPERRRRSAARRLVVPYGQQPIRQGDSDGDSSNGVQSTLPTG